MTIPWNTLQEQHTKDLTVSCPICQASIGQNCNGLFHDDGTPAPELVCFGRRIKRLCNEKGEEVPKEYELTKIGWVFIITILIFVTMCAAAMIYAILNIIR